MQIRYVRYYVFLVDNAGAVILMCGELFYILEYLEREACILSCQASYIAEK